jgi:hypothetical protein
VLAHAFPQGGQWTDVKGPRVGERPQVSLRTMRAGGGALDLRPLVAYPYGMSKHTLRTDRQQRTISATRRSTPQAAALSPRTPKPRPRHPSSVLRPPSSSSAATLSPRPPKPRPRHPSSVLRRVAAAPPSRAPTRPRPESSAQRKAARHCGGVRMLGRRGRAHYYEINHSYDIVRNMINEHMHCYAVIRPMAPIPEANDAWHS